VGDDVIVAAGHTVTLNATHVWGNDTATAITVNGTLAASRTVNSQLTCRGDLYINTGGTLDLGTEASPIPAGVSHTMVLNNSAVMGQNKWGIRTEHTTGAGFAGFRVWGAAKQPYSFLSAPVAAAATVVPVLDATGWAVGDLLGFQPPSGIVVVYRAITAITPTGGTSANITLGASLGRDGVAGNGVLNLTRNVRIIGDQAATFRTHISLRIIGTVNNRIELGPCTIVAGGSGGAGGNWLQSGLNIYYEFQSQTIGVIRKIEGPLATSLISVTGSTEVHVPTPRSGFCFFNNLAAPYSVDSLYVALPSANGQALQYYSGASVQVGSESVLLGGQYACTTQFSQGAVDCSYNGRIWGPQNAIFAVAIAFTFRGATFAGYQNITNMSSAGSLLLEDCTIGPETGAPQNPGNSFFFLTGCLAPVTIRNPTIGPLVGVSRSGSGLVSSHPSHRLELFQINGNPAANERYTRGGRVHRDATRTRRSTASICLASWYAANVLSLPLPAKVQPGATLRIRGSVWIEAGYLPGEAPGIAMTGTGLTATTWSAPAVADAWHDFDLTIVNTNAFPTDVTITLTARSNANTETARVWFDGLYADPWSGDVRHHGWQWLAQTGLVADSRITLTEAAALALPVTEDHVAQTIIVSGPVTARQVFEAAMADLAQTANQGRPVHIASATGESFETTYTVVFTGTGAITGAYQDAGGRRVTISAPALVAGSRVQLYNLTTATQMFNGVLTGGGLTLPATWVADQTVRLRADHPDKLPLETVGVLSSSGLTYLDVQADDTVYMGNAIDGATCTEFVADGTNVQVDINDPDGVTSVQRLYAWAQWYQTTAAGIASDFFGAVSATDAASYQIDQAKADIHLDNVSALPVRVVGGYLARRDGSTVIASTSNSIQMDPGKAYLAGADGLARESTVQAVLALSLG
jgi:hypothetical protein